MLGLIFNDVHFDRHHRRGWRNLLRFAEDARPTVVVADGDLIDLGPISRFDPDEDERHRVVPQIRFAVRELNALLRLLPRDAAAHVIPGNHEARWRKAILGPRADRLRGAKGLSLREQFAAHGLDPRWRWHAGSKLILGRGEGEVLIVHGDRHSGPYASANVASNIGRRFPGRNVVVGHHHRAQLMTQTSVGRVRWSVASPCLARDMDYAPDPNWQRGFTLIDWNSSMSRATPSIVLMDERGGFARGGREYR